MSSDAMADMLALRGVAATLRARSLDKENRDAVTGWPAISWTETSIKVIIEEISSRIVQTDAGPVEERRYKMFSIVSTSRGDEVVVSTDTYLVDIGSAPHKDYEGEIMYYTTVLLMVS